MLHRVQVTDTSRLQLFRGHCVNQAFMVKFLHRTLLKDINNKKRIAWSRKHKQWKYILWSDESKFEIFGSNRCVFVIRRVGDQMISSCMVPTVKHGGGVVMVWECFAGDNVSDLFRIQGSLNQHGHHSILQRYAIPSGLRLVGLSFVFQQDNDPYLQAV